MEKKENNFAHENTWRIRNDIDLKCWIRIRIEINKDPKHSFNKLLQIFNIKSDLIQIHNAGRDVKLLYLAPFGRIFDWCVLFTRPSACRAVGGGRRLPQKQAHCQRNGGVSHDPMDIFELMHTSLSRRSTFTHSRFMSISTADPDPG